MKTEIMNSTNRISIVKLFFVCFLAGYPLLSNAQWRVGILGGGDYNMYTSDRHYLTDLHNEGEWGFTAGVAGMYDVKEWIHSKVSVRTELIFIQKNICTIKGYQKNEIISRHGFLQVPIMANYSYGSDKIRGFVNVGGYGGCKVTNISEWQRKLDIGGLGGIGAEWNFGHLTLQAEARLYASALSATKSDRSFKTPHYNTTLSFQMAIFYNL